MFSLTIVNARVTIKNHTLSILKTAKINRVV